MGTMLNVRVKYMSGKQQASLYTVGSLGCMLFEVFKKSTPIEPDINVKADDEAFNVDLGL